VSGSRAMGGPSSRRLWGEDLPRSSRPGTPRVTVPAAHPRAKARHRSPCRIGRWRTDVLLVIGRE